MFTSISRIIKFAFQNFKRNFWLSLVTISMIVLTLLSVSALGFVNVLGEEALEQVKERVDVSVHFKPEVPPEKVKSVQQQLSGLPKVKSIQFLSREEALENLQEEYKERVVIKESIEELDSNPLGDTLVIKAYDLDYYPSLLAGFDQTPYKDLVDEKKYRDQQVLIDKINRIADKTKRIGVIVSAVYAFIAVLIVFNTIRIAIYTHSEEISIMKLVGSDNWFIRAPFIIEAVFYAVFATLLTLGLLYPLTYVVDPYILDFFDGSFSLLAYYTSHIWLFAMWHTIGTFILTLVASLVAVGRYLDV